MGVGGAYDGLRDGAVIHPFLHLLVKPAHTPRAESALLGKVSGVDHPVDGGLRQPGDLHDLRETEKSGGGAKVVGGFLG